MLLSHTAGLEQEKLEYVLDFIEENPSPSHAVGLERVCKTTGNLFSALLVAIPHGGL